eukprot:CAMPEP_0114473710 /NCGR_PEP_ID=MMETSP0104-20121206/13134_1 /TAXON_ID=37642 ORGANISM="Paraphysomonas imperforata, Strain PA2" /NCGR_SAMPLE_ID=MMETSP0104 /ASSEMBLY_ACC=CAM_ASM_000202 /LENGTH=927 /DNA_ID=CAMNT_0001647927 /DNA_START=60 /DNA_END=2843 /DNA_ORIENTATION=-
MGRHEVNKSLYQKVKPNLPWKLDWLHENLHIVLRSVVGICLLACLVIFGYFSYMLLWQAEDTIYRDNFSATAEELSDKIISLVESVAKDGETLSSLYSVFHPDSSEWPNTYINGYTAIAETLRSSAPPFGGAYILPIVYPENVSGFEDYMQTAYAADPDISPNVSMHVFGFGIYGTNVSTGETFHDTGGRGGENGFLTPVTSYVDHYEIDSHLWNAYGDYELFAKGIDGTFACIQAGNTSCQSMLESDNSGPVPGTLFITPIFPRNDPEVTVGFVVTAFTWSLVLRENVASLANNMYLVISTNEHDAFTTSFRDGVFYIDSEGDSHDRNFNDVNHESIYRLENSQAAVSVSYKMQLYPTREFYDTFHTTLPIITTILSIMMIVATAVFFILYDHFMEKDSSTNKLLLEGKRQFIRFVSQEISTPLNAAVKGLQEMDNGLKDHLQDDGIVGTSSWKYLVYLQSKFEDVRLNADVALVVLNDLQHYDKMEIGKMKLEVGVVDIWSLLLDNISMFSAQTLKEGVNLIVADPFRDIDRSNGSKNLIGSLHVRGDGIRLAQAYRNIVSVALKQSEEDDTVTIKLEWREHGLFDAVIPSLPEGHYAENTIAHRRGSILFTLTHSTRKYVSDDSEEQLCGDDGLQTVAGGGLGLLICKGIVDLHGGKIWANSDETLDLTTVYIELPLFGDERGAPPPSKAEMLSKAVDRRLSAGKIFPDGRKKQHYSPLHGNNDDFDETVGEDRTCHVEMIADFPLRAESRHRTLRAEAKSHSAALKSPRSAGSARSSSDFEHVGGQLEAVPDVLTEDMMKMSVLVVDDAMIGRKFVCRGLRHKGFSCDMAEDGEDCLNILMEKSDYDVLLIDRVMPKMSGPETTEKVREKYGNEKIIIGMSGSVLPEDLAEFTMRGADGILEKPVDVNSFLTALEDAIMRRNL